MPEVTLDPGGAEALDLQRALVRVALAPGADGAWPEAEIRVPPKHRAAFARFRPGLLTYRELVRASLWDPVEAVFPVARALLGEEAWAACRAAFLAAGAVQSRHYRDIPATFVGWLAESRWGGERWPELLQLAHFEWVEIQVSCAPDPPADFDLAMEPAPGLRLRLHPSAHPLEYAYAVHLASPENPRPRAAPTHLLAFRDAADQYQLLELTPATSALLARGQREDLGAAMAALGLADAAPVFRLLMDLRQRGALMGFEP